MSPKLALLQRQLKIAPGEKPPVPDTSGLGAAIDAMVQQAVQQQVADALERQPVKQSPHVRRLTDAFNAPAPLPPAPRTRPMAPMEMQFQRNELGQINIVNTGDMQFRVQRNELGQIVRMIPADIAEVPPAIEPPELKQARKYNDGEPR